MLFFIINLGNCKMCMQSLSFFCGSICIKERTYTNGYQSIEDPLHCFIPLSYHDKWQELWLSIPLLCCISTMEPLKSHLHVWYGEIPERACHCRCRWCASCAEAWWSLFHLTFTSLVRFEHFVYVWRPWCMASWSFDEQSCLQFSHRWWFPHHCHF